MVTTPFSNTTTSLAAAIAIEPHAETLRERVYAAIVKAGERGATDEEIQAATGMDGNTQRPRRVELARAGAIEVAGLRKTTANKDATVWVAKETGR